MEGSTATVTPTASAPTPTTPAAPATSAPSASPAPAERPTFAQAFAADAAPPPESSPAPTETAATAQAETTPTESAGPIPFLAHKTALENARKKERDAVTQELQSQYGWAMQADRAAIEQAQHIGQLYAQDKPAFIRNLLAEAMGDPNLAPLVRSEAARALGARTQPPQPADQDLTPDIPVMDANGQVVAQTFSAEKVQQIVQQAVQQALDREVGPIKQDFQTRQQREQAEREQQQFQQTVQDIYSEAADVLPGFTEHEAEIAKVFATIPGDPAKALRAAWKQVVGGKLGNVDQVKATTLKELQTKAAAASVNPAATAIPATKRPTSFYDAGLQWG